jgi:hypothetical protein
VLVVAGALALACGVLVLVRRRGRVATP